MIILIKKYYQSTNKVQDIRIQFKQIPNSIGSERFPLRLQSTGAKQDTEGKPDDVQTE